MSNKKNNKGFTLVELLVALAILTILSAIAVPIYVSYVSSSKKTEAKTNLQSLRLLLEQYYSENGRYFPSGGTSPYTYTEDNSGTKTCSNCIDSYLTGFTPRAAGISTAVLYNYTVSISGNTYTITAAPVTSRGAPSGNLTIDQNGTKTGW